MRAQLVGQLRQCPVVIQARHRSEITRVEIRRSRLGDQSIGIGRVAHDQDLDIAAGYLVHGCTLWAEYRPVGGQQIGAFHARAAGPCANQQRIIRTLERHFCIIGGDDVRQQGKCRVAKFHDNPLQRTERGRDFQ